MSLDSETKETSSMKVRNEIFHSFTRFGDGLSEDMKMTYTLPWRSRVFLREQYSGFQDKPALGRDITLSGSENTTFADTCEG